MYSRERGAGKLLNFVGAGGFEPPTSWSRTKRASRAALRPEQKQYTISFPAFQGENMSLHRKKPESKFPSSSLQKKRGSRRD